MQKMHNGIGENIRQLRKRRGLSIGKLVDLVSIESGEAITDQYASAMERGERTVPTRLLVPLAKALHCTMSDLFGIAPPEDDVQAMRRMLIEDIAALPEDEIRIMWNVARIFGGNKSPLIQCVGMYISLKEGARAEAARPLIEIYNREADAGNLVADAPDVGSEYVDTEYRRLRKNAKR